MKQLKILTNHIFLNLLIITLLFSCDNGDRASSAYEDSTINSAIASDEPINVSVSYAQLKDFSITSIATGVIKFPVQSRLSFRTSGIISQINVHNGSSVLPGQILAQLDSQDQLLSIRQSQDQLLEAQVALRALIAEYGGNGLDTNSVSSNARTFVLTKSGFYKAHTALVKAKQQLEYTILRAPYSGKVANLSSKSFNFITSYESFCSLLNQSELVTEFSILESELPHTKVGQLIKIIPISNPNQLFIGHIVEINPIVSSQGLVLIKAKFDNLSNTLFEGMNARIIIDRKIKNQLVIPKLAVVERAGRKVVFTVKNGLTKWNFVDIIYENELEVTIGKGLISGDCVIVSGDINLTNGVPVKFKKA